MEKKIFLASQTQAQIGSWREKIRVAGVWFVDIPRTSSSSIIRELETAYGPPWGKSIPGDICTRSEPLMRPHITARVMRQYLGDQIWSKLLVFSMIRNPWDRAISIYRYRLSRGHFNESLSFKDYLALQLRNCSKVESALFKYPAFRRSQFDFLSDRHGNIIVDRILRYETRADDLAKLSADLDIECLGSLHLVASTSDQTRSYREYYDSETESLVEMLYPKDIDFFGYRFDDEKEC